MPVMTSDEMGAATTVLQPQPLPSTPSNLTTVVEAVVSPAAVIDTRWGSFNDLSPFVAGSFFKVNYYSQIRSKEQQLAGIEVATNPVYQTYHVIQGLELKVSSPNQPTQDQATTEFQINGTAITPPGLYANVGDMFITDFGQGRAAVYKVTTAIQRGVFSESLYEIGYEVVSTDLQVIQNLIDKEAKRSVYRRDLLIYQRNPIIASDDIDTFDEIGRNLGRYLKSYIDRFYRPECTTLAIPGQYMAYDPYVLKFLKDIFSDSDCFDITKLNVFDTSAGLEYQKPSVYDLVRDRLSSLFSEVFSRAGLLITAYFPYNLAQRSIRLSTFVYCMYPIGATVGTSSGNLSHQGSGDPQQLSTIDGDALAQMKTTVIAGQPMQDTVLPSIAQSDYYVFGPGFYSQTVASMSAIERMVYSYIVGEPINQWLLLDTLKKMPSWGLIEQFYWTPILLTIAKHLLQGGK